jgi:uncharacterized membrane protein
VDKNPSSDLRLKDYMANERRVASLDVMRGFAVLAFITVHISVFAILFGLVNAQGGFTFTPLPPATFEWPLATGLLYFFFVTGVSLAVSLSIKKKSFSVFGRRVILRYGIYLVSAMILDLAMNYIISLYVGYNNWPWTVDGVLTEPSSFFTPVVGLALSAILAFPFVFYLSWRKLLALAIGEASLVSLILYLYPVHTYFGGLTPLNPFLTGYYSMLKGFPIVILGAVIGKLMMDGKDLKKTMTIVGALISILYVIVPALLGSGLEPLATPIWEYPHATLFLSGSCLFLFGLIQLIEARHINLSPLRVLGRFSLYIFYGQFLLLPSILLPLESLGIKVTFELLLGLDFVSLIVIWILAYVYSKWRWGNPSKW